MKFTTLSITAFAAHVSGHAIFQDLWVNGVDKSNSCVRMPTSNSPVTVVSSSAIRCNASPNAAPGKCAVTAGSTVAVEMHQQPGDRSCSNEAIGGAHYGPVIVYLSKVSDSSTADGSSGWFKIFQDGWSKVSGSSSGDSDNWGTKDLNNCCGKMNVKIPSDIASGDYLLRAEVIALHTAGSSGGAQFYISCYQLTISGGGSATPATVSFPGAYSASDPGILVNIHSSLSTYVVPGPAVYSGGSTKSPGSGCSGADSGTTAAASTTTKGAATTTSTTTARTTTSGFVTTTTTTAGGSSGGCTVAKYGQCGGTGWTGCKTCASGSTCSAVSPPYYSQCV